MDDIAHPTKIGATDGPVYPDAWKRAVFRRPPAHFDVEMMAPEKQGGNYNFGMRICPIRDDGVSQSSSGSHSEYVIWRRWEDCLWFQESLELEYSRMARAKRQRLLQGRGVKKNGIYIHDQAASFESLPPGPDPNSVAKDVHQFLPKLSKKGTVFRTTPAVTEQRHKELQALVESLWKKNYPALIMELIESRTVTDFFSFWRRDSDLAAKQKARTLKLCNSDPRNSVSSSVFSMYFAHSTSQLPNPDLDLSPSPKISTFFQQSSEPHKSNDRPHTSNGSPSPRQPLAPRQLAASEGFLRPKRSNYPQSVVSSEGSVYGLPPQASKQPTPITAPVIMTQEVPIVFGHNPDYMSNDSNDRPLSLLQSLPEDYELKTPTSFVFGDELPAPASRPLHISSPEFNRRRHAQVFDSPPSSPVSTAETCHQPISNESSPSRLSWQSTTSVASSASSYLDGLDIALPESPLDSPDRTRQSICSVTSIMTTCSADAVVPRSLPTSSTMPPRPNPRRSLSEERSPMSIPEVGEGSECDSDSVYDTYVHGLTDSFQMDPPSPTLSSHKRSFPKTPLGHVSPNPPQLTSFFPPNGSRPSTALSIRTVMSSSSFGTDKPPVASPTRENSLAIKVMYNESIISFRTSCHITFDELRQRVYEKFVNQEGLPLSETFSIAYLLPQNVVKTDHVDPARARCRSDSMSSTGISDHTQMRCVTSQLEWDMVVASAGRTKLSLRVLENPNNN